MIKTTYKLADIITNPHLMVRVHHDEKAITDYAQAMKQGAVFPPPIVGILDGTLTLIAGYHRYFARLRVYPMQDEMEWADAGEVDLEQAMTIACHDNATNGIRMTREDRIIMVERAIANFPDHSARKIAEITGVSHPFASQIKRDMLHSQRPLEEGSNAPPPEEPDDSCAGNVTSAGAGKDPKEVHRRNERAKSADPDDIRAEVESWINDEKLRKHLTPQLIQQLYAQGKDFTQRWILKIVVQRWSVRQCAQYDAQWSGSITPQSTIERLIWVAELNGEYSGTFEGWKVIVKK